MERADKNFPKEDFRKFCGSRPKVDRAETVIISEFHPTKQLTFQIRKNCKETFLGEISRINVLTIFSGGSNQPLVSLSYFSSDEEIVVDDSPSVTKKESSDSGIVFIACYSQQPPQGHKKLQDEA